VLSPLPPTQVKVFSAIRIQTVLAVVVVLNLIGLTIAAYHIFRKK
jgi:hypothetical protein